VSEQGWAAPDTTADVDPGSAWFRAPSVDPESGAPPAARAAPTLPVPLRPMTLSDLLDGAFAVIKARPRTVFTIAAVILVPTHLLASFLQKGAASSFSVTNTLNSFDTGRTSSVNDADVLWAYAATALLALSLFFLGGAIGRLVTAWYAGGDVSASEALAASFRRTPAFVAAFLLLLVPKLVGLAFCGIGALVPVALFSLTAPVMVVEGLGPIAGAKRSWLLIGHRFWKSLLVVIIAYVGSSILTSVFGGVPTLLASALPAPFDWIGTAAVSAGVAMIVTTALVSVSVLMYLDLRIRTEGLDIELDATDAFPRAR
jgi:flagellar biosynthesis protein FlhB